MAFIAVAIVGPLIGVRLLDAATEKQVKLGDLRGDLDALLRTQLAEETALRGYTATGDRFFLDPDGPPNRQFGQQEAALAAALVGQGLPDGAVILGRLGDTHSTWESEVALPLLRNPRSGDSDPRQAYGKILTDQMRLDATLVREQLATASRRVEQMLRREIDTTVAISVGLVTAFAIVALWYAVGRSQAVDRLAHERVLVDALQRTLRVGGVSLPNTRMGFAYASATTEALVGGDLLDAWRSGPEEGWFVIADASGKGIGAARHAAFAQYAMRALAAEYSDPAAVLDRFNRLFLTTFDDPSAFMVVFLARFDARSRTLVYASAGHGTAYVRRGEIIERLAPTGALVGLDTQQQYGSEEVPLAVGDLVLLATDGLTEARDPGGMLLGEDRVAQIFANGPLDPQLLCDRLVAAADAFSGGVQDDLAIVALRVVQPTDAAPAFSPLGTQGGAPSQHP